MVAVSCSPLSMISSRGAQTNATDECVDWYERAGVFNRVLAEASTYLGCARGLTGHRLHRERPRCDPELTRRSDKR